MGLESCSPKPTPPCPPQLVAAMGPKPPNWIDLLPVLTLACGGLTASPCASVSPPFKQKIRMASPSWGCGRLSDGTVYGDVDRRQTLNSLRILPPPSGRDQQVGPGSGLQRALHSRPLAPGTWPPPLPHARLRWALARPRWALARPRVRRAGFCPEAPVWRLGHRALHPRSRVRGRAPGKSTGLDTRGPGANPQL